MEYSWDHRGCRSGKQHCRGGNLGQRLEICIERRRRGKSCWRGGKYGVESYGHVNSVSTICGKETFRGGQRRYTTASWLKHQIQYRSIDSIDRGGSGLLCGLIYERFSMFWLKCKVCAILPGSDVEFSLKSC